MRKNGRFWHYMNAGMLRTLDGHSVGVSPSFLPSAGAPGGGLATESPVSSAGISDTSSGTPTDSAAGGTNGDFASTIAGLLPNGTEGTVATRSHASEQSAAWPPGSKSQSTDDTVKSQSFGLSAAQGPKTSFFQVVNGSGAVPSGGSDAAATSASSSVPNENGPTVLAGPNGLLWSLLLASSRTSVISTAPAEDLASTAIQDARVVGQQSPSPTLLNAPRGAATSKQLQPTLVPKTKADASDRKAVSSMQAGQVTRPLPPNSFPFDVKIIALPADPSSLPQQVAQDGNKPVSNQALLPAAPGSSALAFQSGAPLLQAPKSGSPFNSEMPEFFSFGLDLTALPGASMPSDNLTAATRAVVASLASRSAGPASAVVTSAAVAPQTGGEPKLVIPTAASRDNSGSSPVALGSALASTTSRADLGTSTEQKPTMALDAIAEEGAPGAGKTLLKGSDSSANFPEHASSFEFLNAAAGVGGPSLAAELGRQSDGNSVSSSTLSHSMPETSSDAAKEVLVRLESATGETISIRVFDRAGQVQVSVRSSDPVTAQHLRSDLSTLTANLETAGWKANVSPAAPDMSNTRAAANSSPDQSSSDSTPDKRSLTWDDQDSDQRSNIVADLWDEILKRGTTYS